MSKAASDTSCMPSPSRPLKESIILIKLSDSSWSPKVKWSLMQGIVCSRKYIWVCFYIKISEFRSCCISACLIRSCKNIALYCFDVKYGIIWLQKSKYIICCLDDLVLSNIRHCFIWEIYWLRLTVDAIDEVILAIKFKAAYLTWYTPPIMFSNALGVISTQILLIIKNCIIYSLPSILAVLGRSSSLFWAWPSIIKMIFS